MNSSKDNCNFPSQAVVEYSIEYNMLIGRFAEYAYISLDDAANIVKDRLHICNGKLMPALIHGPRKVAMSPYAFKFVLSKESRIGLKALATVEERYSKLKMAYSNFLLSLFVRDIPIRIFKKEHQARAWLKSHV